MTVSIKLRPEEPLDKALRRLKRILDKEGTTRELKRHRFYEKPSAKRRRKVNEQLRARRKEARKRAKRRQRTLVRARQAAYAPR